MAENEDDLDGATRQRTSREEVRRRNREIMERANAELREGRSANSLAAPLGSGRKELSRFPLIKQAREGAQTFWTPYEFHTSTPELSFGPLRVDIPIDQNRFTDFNTEHMKQAFNECLKNTCLIDDISIAHLDLINPEEVFNSSRDPLDDPLLTNDVSAAVGDANTPDAVYTGHFLRKPQLMSNDLFTEGSLRMGHTNSRFSIPMGNRESAVDQEFDAIASFDERARKGETVLNSIAKKPMRIKRVLSILPEECSGDITQLKFEEKNVLSGKLAMVMNRQFQSYELPQSTDSNMDPSALTFVKKRKFIQMNKVAADSTHDEYYLLSIPRNDSTICRLSRVGHKILLKRDATASTGDDSIIVNLSRSES